MLTNAPEAPRVDPAVDHAQWIASMPYETRYALAVAEDAQVAVDLEQGGPVFYEVEVNLLRVSSNMGAVVGAVVEAVTTELRRRGVDNVHVRAIVAAIRRSGYETPGGYNLCLAQVLRWITVADDSWDD